MEFGEAIHLEQRPTQILVNGLVCLKLIASEDGGLYNSTLVSELLVSSSPKNMIDVLGWQNDIVYPGQVDFTEALRANSNIGLKHFEGSENNLYDRLAHNKKLEKTFQDAMSSLSRSANHMLAAEVDFSSIKHLVDAGGGDATNAITLAKAHPHLKITIFDLPSVCKIAQKNIEQAGLADRIFTHEGNFFETDFPEAIDAIIFSHMLTIWSPENDTKLLKRAYDALPKYGCVIIFNMMADDGYSGPMTAALGSPYFIAVATGEGMLYAWKEYESFLENAGFKGISRQKLPRDHGVIIGKK
jgi:predicted O-methyltransferase YrrM